MNLPFSTIAGTTVWAERCEVHKECDAGGHAFIRKYDKKVIKYQEYASLLLILHFRRNERIYGHLLPCPAEFFPAWNET